MSAVASAAASAVVTGEDSRVGGDLPAGAQREGSHHRHNHNQVSRREASNLECGEGDEHCKNNSRTKHSTTVSSGKTVIHNKKQNMFNSASTLRPTNQYSSTTPTGRPAGRPGGPPAGHFPKFPQYSR